MFPFLRFVLFVVMFAGGALFSGLGMAATEKAAGFSFDFYKNKYSVNPAPVEGTTLGFEQVKPYVLIVFPDMKTKKMKRADTIYMVNLLVLGYQNVYDDGIQILMNRLILADKWAGDDEDVLRDELKELFRAGGMKAAIAAFDAGDDPSWTLHFGQVQELYLRHLTAVYVFNMLVASPEGKAAIAAYEESIKGDEETNPTESKD